MTDQTIPADVHPEDMAHARAYVQDVLDATYTPDRILAVARVLQALLPTPARPTLADMTEEERAGCQWMQADIIGGDEPLVITRIDQTYWSALILDRNGRYDEVPAKHVTPRPDLPRMTWPGDQNPAPAPALPDWWRLADHPDHGRVIVTNPTPESDGYAYCVFPSDMDCTGFDWRCYSPEALTYIDTHQEEE